MAKTENVAATFMALCKQGRAEEALRIAAGARFSDLIVALNDLADACRDDLDGEIERHFILEMEHFLLDTRAGRTVAG